MRARVCVCVRALRGPAKTDAFNIVYTLSENFRGRTSVPAFSAVMFGANLTLAADDDDGDDAGRSRNPSVPHPSPTETSHLK